MTPARTVDEYFAKVPKERRAALQKLRATIAAAAPGAIEVITYQMPGFKAHGRALVSYASFSDHYSLFPMGVSVVRAHEKELAAYLSGKSTLRFSFEKPLPAGVVRMVVRERLAENKAKAAKTVVRSTAKRR